MSKNPQAKRLAQSFDISYSEALGVIRDESELAEELADHENTSIRAAMEKLAADYPMVRARAAQDGVSFRTALDRIRDEQARQRRFGDAAASFPTVEQLLRKALVGACDDLTDEPVHRDGEDDLEVHGLHFDEVDLPDHVDDIEIDVVTPDLDTMIWDEAEELEGETYVGTVKVRAEVSFSGFMHRGDTYAHEGEITVIVPDWNERTSQVSLHRQVILEFNATVIPGAESVELEFVSAMTDEFPPDPHSIGV
ncbi:hypothetical protein ACTMSW_24830 [Micromonospora sp. BQ11]|uniref:hypothetical protein n=1 Tax=Micromonospora sp. BQ11 TaxID=3452212 RepID=UPI003F896968